MHQPRLTLLTVGMAIAAMLVLAGCASSSVEPAVSSPSASDSSERGDQLASILCETNVAIVAFNSVWEEPTSTLNEIVEAAATAGDATQAAADALDPAVLDGADPADVTLARDDFLTRTADYRSIEASTDVIALSEFVFTYSEEALDAVPRIVTDLGVEPGSC